MKRMQNREKLPCPNLCPQGLYALLLDCWRLDTKLRIDAGALKEGIDSLAQSIGIHPNSDITWPLLPTLQERRDEAQEYSKDQFQPENSIDMSSLEIDVRDLELQEELGRGQFGAVHRAVFAKNGVATLVAVKSLLASVGVPEVERQSFEYEARLLCSLRHAHIVSALGVCFKQQPNMLIIELMESDLRTYLKAHRTELSHPDYVPTLTHACAQISSAMHYLEQRKIIHRDLAAR
jgi:serine/threonine protein kinase